MKTGQKPQSLLLVATCHKINHKTKQQVKPQDEAASQTTRRSSKHSTATYCSYCIANSSMSPSFPDQVELLKELKEISSARHKRAHNHPPKTLPEKENTVYDACSKNEFLQQTAEKTDLNQYWYSQGTIETILGAIRESWNISGDKRVAFLSTPSLFFSLSEEERKNCALFDVSPFVVQISI